MTYTQHAIVTGGLGGIGKAIALQLHTRGDAVTIFDCIPETDARVSDLSFPFSYYRVDLASYDSIMEGFTHFFSTFTPHDRLTLLVNNAGITNDAMALRISEKSWDSVLDINLKGLFFCAQQALKHMIKNKHGYIINMSSIVGTSGNAGQASYAASKAGINALTKSLAQEYGSRSILINAIAPGFITTEMTQKLSSSIQETIRNRIALKRFGEPSDIAYLVDFLSSGKADYITGHVFGVDGGLQ